jgi:hypothetical protein
MERLPLCSMPGQASAARSVAAVLRRNLRNSCLLRIHTALTALLLACGLQEWTAIAVGAIAVYGSSSDLPSKWREKWLIAGVDGSMLALSRSMQDAAARSAHDSAITDPFPVFRLLGHRSGLQELCERQMPSEMQLCHSMAVPLMSDMLLHLQTCKCDAVSNVACPVNACSLDRSSRSFPGPAHADGAT